MRKLLLITFLVMLDCPAFAKEYIVKEISDPLSDKPYYFEPSDLVIEPGDTVIFVNTQEDTHDVMFDVVPQTVIEPMIMGPMQEKEGDKWSYTFTVPGTYQFHCHPHQAAGMTGTLVVGEPSKAGKTKTIDHGSMMHNDNAEAHDHVQ